MHFAMKEVGAATDRDGEQINLALSPIHIYSLYICEYASERVRYLIKRMSRRLLDFYCTVAKESG